MRVIRVASIHLLRAPPTEMGRSPYVAQNGVEVHTEQIQCRRLVRSPQPCVAIAPSEVDQERFRSVTHLRATREQIGSARVIPPILLGDLKSLLADRMDGVALLADSLGEDSPIGRIRDLFRFFERAFKRGPGECVDPVTTFLRSHPRHDALQYSKAEVQHWFEVLRATSMHADRRSTYARSTDVAPYLGRMEVAAYDVLFNKEYWRRPSASRRGAMELAAGVEPTGGRTVVMGAGAAVHIQWMDPWGGYPTERVSRITLPDEWISRLSPADT